MTEKKKNVIVFVSTITPQTKYNYYSLSSGTKKTSKKIKDKGIQLLINSINPN